ncbi:MAG: hypothetical protein BWY11_02115 [Firmicutes bacterium ADurb.Bin182]|nr:MAG: hypothetical protein BWY11_02115 [Firmicutes bacterium ADurb.Bin182]
MRYPYYLITGSDHLLKQKGHCGTGLPAASRHNKQSCLFMFLKKVVFKRRKSVLLKRI